MSFSSFTATRCVTLLSLACAVLLANPAAAQQRPLKVFISIDMEGLTGVVTGSDVGGTNGDYQYFRKIMAEEANAAIAGAMKAGATEVVVRDSRAAQHTPTIAASRSAWP